VALPFTLKSILKQKKRIKETQIFHHAKIYSSKNHSKRNQNPSRYYYNSIITNLKFQHKPKMSSFKNPHIKIDCYLRAKVPFKLLYSLLQ
jgi:hypothetical protein